MVSKKVHRFARVFGMFAKSKCEDSTRKYLDGIGIQVDPTKAIHDAALEFLLSEKSIDCVLVGMRNPEYVGACLSVLEAHDRKQ